MSNSWYISLISFSLKNMSNYALVLTHGLSSPRPPPNAVPDQQGGLKHVKSREKQRYPILFFYLSNSLIIHKVKTKEITTVMMVLISGLN